MWVLFTSDGDFQNSDGEFSIFNLENYHLYSFFRLLSDLESFHNSSNLWGFMASPFYKYIFPGNLLGQDSGAPSPSITLFDTACLLSACSSWGVCRPSFPLRQLMCSGCCPQAAHGPDVQEHSHKSSSAGPYSVVGLQHHLRRSTVEPSWGAGC